MTNKLLLVTNERFGTLDCNFWRDKHNNIYVTRNQIGEGLGYTSPDIAISKIHSRNKTRLDKFSVITKLVSTDGKEYETTLYNRQGIYEICRHSKMKKADEFYDWVYSVLDTLHEEKIFHAVQREIEKNNRRTLSDAIKESDKCDNSHHMKFSNLIIKVVTGLQPNQIKKRLGVDKTVVTADILSSDEVKQVKEVESKVIMLLDLDFDYYQIKAALYGEPLTVGTTKKMTS